MKKRLFGAFLLILCFVLVGCDKNTIVEPPSQPEIREETQTEEQETQEEPSSEFVEEGKNPDENPAEEEPQTGEKNEETEEESQTGEQNEEVEEESQTGEQNEEAEEGRKDDTEESEEEEMTANGFVLETAENGLRYAYFAPEKEGKFPLVIYLHGKFHGFTDRSFTDSGLLYWTREDMQSLFSEGGAYLWMPKLPETTVSVLQTQKVTEGIRSFVDTHQESIDTEKIYLMGGSAGGGLAWNILIKNPDYFAKAVILCATKTPSESELRKVADIPIWMVSAKTDPIISYEKNQKKTWEKLCRCTNVPEGCRWTVFEKAVTLPNGSQATISHFLAKTIGYNFCTLADKEPFPDMRTINGNGENVSVTFDNAVMQWLQTETQAADEKTKFPE